MSKLLKYLVTLFVKPVLSIYLKKERIFHYKNLELLILKGIFHPNFFFSSKYLASFVEKLNVTGKTFCEPCAGSGLISFIALQNGAIVTCFDINTNAIRGIQLNLQRNSKHLKSQKITAVESDLFSNVPAQQFDFIVLNPPYFFSDYSSVEQAAWNAGKNGAFFITFFTQLKDYTNKNSEIYMVLADNCDIKRIANIARDKQWKLLLIEQKQILWETNYIYRIQLL
ncbi:MAG: methyltransferase [Bacteroidetes bacterium]|nr:methyltransferase [Bacteroidota bacterium]